MYGCKTHIRFTTLYGCMNVIMDAHKCICKNECKMCEN